MFWTAPKENIHIKRNPAELSLAVWNGAFSDRLNQRSTVDLMLACLVKLRHVVKTHKHYVTQKTFDLDVHLSQGQQLVLTCGHELPPVATRRVVQTPYWQLRVAHCPPGVVGPAFARPRPELPLADVTPVWASKKWRHPRDRSLPYWRRAVAAQPMFGLRRNSTVGELALLVGLYNPRWVLSYLENPQYWDVTNPDYTTGQTPRHMDDYVLTLQSPVLSASTVEFLQSALTGGLRHLIRTVSRFGVTEWRNARRDWRGPRDRSLAHWRHTVARQRSIRTRSALVSELGIFTQFYDAKWLLSYLADPRDSVEYPPVYISNKTPQHLSAHALVMRKPLISMETAEEIQVLLSESGLQHQLTIMRNFGRDEWYSARHPRDRSLPYWRNIMTRLYGVKRSRRIAPEVVTLLIHGPSGSENPDLYTSRLAPRIHEDVYDKYDIKNLVLPVTRRQSLWQLLTRARHSELEQVHVGSFAQKLLTQICQDEDLIVVLPRNWHAALLDDFRNPVFSKFQKHIKNSPEYSAMIALGFLTASINERETDKLNVILRLLPELMLLPAFVQMLERLETAADGDVVNSDEKFILQLFLRGVGLRLAPLSEDATEAVFLEDVEFSHATVITKNGGYAAGNEIDMQGVDRWVLSGQVPLSLVSKIAQTDGPDVSICGASNLLRVVPDQVARVSGSAPPLELKRMSTQRLPVYSVREEQLSALTAKLAKRIIDAFRQLVGPHEAQVWLEALELPLDDLLFGATIDFWSVLSRIQDAPELKDVIFVRTPDMARAYIAGLRSLGLDHEVTLISPVVDVPLSDNMGTFRRDALWQAFGDVDPQSQDIVHDAARDALAVSDDQSFIAKGTVFLIGRNFDRNYVTDLVELGQQLQKQHRVAFVPTASLRGNNKVLSFIDTMMSDWCDEVVLEPAFALWSPLGRSSEIVRGVGASVVVNEAQAVAPFTLDETALLLYAAPQIRMFLGDKIFCHLKAGSLMSQAIINTVPRYMAVLPGRDYIARVAAFAGRAVGVSSFDVQTVFVGPRARYKTTAANIQFAIETESKKLFQRYFGLSADKTVLTGCAKIGEVQEAARKLDVQATRDLINMGDKRLLVFACSPFLEADQLIIESLSKSLENMPNTCLGVRLHPTAKPGYPEYIEGLAQQKPSVFVLGQLNLPQTLIAADILITRFSNVGLEAALLGKDVITCNFNDGIVPIRLDEMGVSAVACSSQELLTCMTDFARQGPLWSKLQDTRAAYIAQNQQLLEPNAAEKIYDEMEKYHARVQTP